MGFLWGNSIELKPGSGFGYNSKNLKYSLTSVPHYKIRYITGSKWSGRISAGKKEKCSFDAPWLMIFDLSPLCGYQNRIEILLQEKKLNWDHHIQSIIYNYDNYLGQSISTFCPKILLFVLNPFGFLL